MLIELIKKRRSVRVFSEKKILKEEIRDIIEAGIWAPTGCNNQELRFLILENMDEIKKFKPLAQSSSHFILIFVDMSLPQSKMYDKKNKTNLQYIDAGLALQNMVLYAKSIGIDSCICNLSSYHFAITNSIFRKIMNKITSFIDEVQCKYSFEYFVRKKLKMPNQFKIMCGVALGYGKIEPNLDTIHGGRKIRRKMVDDCIIK